MRTLLLATLTLIAAAVSRGSNANSASWETYYLQKDDSRLAELWDRTIGRGALSALPKSRDIMVGFFGTALRGHSDLIKSRIKSIDQFPEEERDYISLILWWSDDDYSRELLRKSGQEDIAATPCPSLKNRSLLSIDDVGFLMGSFYASGDLEALDPLIECVMKADSTKADPRSDKAGGALWVLCEKHPCARTRLEKVLQRSDLSESARKAFLFALGKIEAPSAETAPTETSH